MNTFDAVNQANAAVEATLPDATPLCGRCKRSFKPKRPWGRFCSDRCRKQANQVARRDLLSRPDWLKQLESALRATLCAVRSGDGVDDAIQDLRGALDGQSTLYTRYQDALQKREWTDELICEVARIPSVLLLTRWDGHESLNKQTARQLERFLNRYGWRAPDPDLLRGLRRRRA
jgi:hypothetical protein